MAWRKWLVRSLVFTVAGGVVVAAFAYQHWTNPSFVRRQVIANLEDFPGTRDQELAIGRKRDRIPRVPA